MRSAITRHVFNTLVDEWGVSKILQIVLLAAAAASITVVVGANTISNQSKITEKEYEE